MLIADHTPIPCNLLVPAPCHFNPGLVVDGDGFKMAYRTEHGNNVVKNYVCHLNSALVPVEGSHTEILSSEFRREDFRLFKYRGDLYGAYSVYPNDKLPRQAYAKIARDGALVDERFVVVDERLPEKNLQFFEHNGDLLFTYSVLPNHQVFNAFDGEPVLVSSTATKFEWLYGEIHGGTPPLLVDGLYWSFFHSHMWHHDRKTYFVGVYAFQTSHPFRVVKMTRHPIMLPGPKGWKQGRCVESWQELTRVVFPSGAALLPTKEFLVAYGHNDVDMCLVKIPVNQIRESFYP